MKIKLKKKEAISIFHTALCNGLSYMSGYGITLDYDDKHYILASDKKENHCWEDVLIQILVDGNPLNFVDEEGEETHEVFLKDVLKNIVDTDVDVLMNIINERDDALDADIVLQTVVFGEVIYG